MSVLRRVVVVFNPSSTGDGEAMAGRLREELAESRPELPVELVPTEHAGHGRELARELAAPGLALVSASGDGGYHDVVNGVMESGVDGVVTAVLAAGNANDHRRATRRRPLAEAITANDVSRLDLLVVRRGSEVEYAHSYAGLGLTPAVAVALERGGKGSLAEITATVRTLRALTPVGIERDGKLMRFDAVVCATVDQMAKYVTLSTDSAPDDGRFEVIELPHVPTWRYPALLLRAARGRLPQRPPTTSYGFVPVAATLLQLDGEVRELRAGEPVVIDIAPRALATVR